MFLDNFFIHRNQEESTICILNNITVDETQGLSPISTFPWFFTYIFLNYISHYTCLSTKTASLSRSEKGLKRYDVFKTKITS